jgi:hypothetical protein
MSERREDDRVRATPEYKLATELLVERLAMEAHLSDMYDFLIQPSMKKAARRVWLDYLARLDAERAAAAKAAAEHAAQTYQHKPAPGIH